MNNRALILVDLNETATRYGISPDIVYGVCMAESSMNQYATRHEDHYRWLYKPEEMKIAYETIEQEVIFQKTSWGLLQVMGAVLREYGYRKSLPDILQDHKAQLAYGCRHLSKNLQKFGLYAGISAYNAGTPRIDKATGKFQNQSYVDKVFNYAKGFE